jgi:hypothetical protein
MSTDSAQPNETVYFTDKSAGVYQIEDWYWEFGDGNDNVSRNTTHTYTKDGYYNVTLYIIDNQSHIANFYQMIHIDSVSPRILSVSHSPNFIGSGTPVTIYADFFDNQSRVDATKINITYPDNSSKNFIMYASEDTPHDYEYVFYDTAQYGQYNYSLWVVDNANNSNSSSGFSFESFIDFTLNYPPDGSTDIESNPELNVTVTNKVDDSLLNITFMHLNANLTTKHVIEYNFRNARAIQAVYIDTDGDIDIIGAAYFDNDITWWENIGNEMFSKHVVDGNFDGAFSVYATDIDSDEDIDILGAAQDDNDIAWWENNHTRPNDDPNKFTKHVIDDNFLCPTDIFAIDINADGDVDVLSASWVGTLVWWENDGSRSFYEKQFISDFFEGAFSIYAIDMDNDGDVDVLGTSDYTDDIVWWENDGNEVFGKHTIDYNFYGARDVSAADIDGDGDVDILGAASGANEVAWWENNHTRSNDDPNKFTKHVIDEYFGGAHSVYATDIDSDEDIDILGAARYDDDIAWWENDGNEVFEKHVPDGNFDGACSIYAADINSDRYTDILGAAYDQNDIAWWENNQSIGQEFNVTSGSNAKYNWTGLSLNTKYFWRVIASDENDFVFGPIWNFTTVEIEVTSVSACPDPVGYGFNVTFHATVADYNDSVTDVAINITYPDGDNGNFPMDYTENSIYEYVFNDTWQNGQYTYTVWAVNDAGSSSISSGHSFTVSAQANVTISTLKNTYGENESINLTDPPREPPAPLLIERGLTWNKYLNTDTQEYTLDIATAPINYQDSDMSWQPIQCSLSMLDQDDPDYELGYRIGNDHGLYSVVFKPDMQSEYPILFRYDKTHAVQLEYLGIGYLDPSRSWQYQVIQQPSSGMLSVEDNHGRYMDVFTGGAITWS